MPINTGQSSVSVNLPAPIGGLNGRDPLANMAATDAILLDNIFPDTATVTTRRGFDEHADTGTAAVETLEVYTGANGDVLLAWAGSKIYSIADNGTPTEKSTGLTSAQAITAMFSNASDDSQHLIAVNGADTPRHFDGTTVANLTMTGITGSTLTFVFTFKERLYFAVEDKLGFAYLPVGAIQGALSYFDLAQVSAKGGYLLSIASFSVGSSGETPTDYIVFITSKGELIVYSGYDPSAAANWELVGRYFAPVPIGRKCAVNYGGELLLITQSGLIAFSDIRSFGDSKAGLTRAKNSAISSKLGKYLSELVPIGKGVQGWTGLEYSGGGGWLLLNAPAGSSVAGSYYQFVMNTTTNAWCRFTGMNGLCWTVYKDELYFGAYNGNIYKADTGTDDDGDDILVQAKQAYNYFEDGSGLGQLQKHFQWAKMVVSCDGEAPITGKFSVDFKDDNPVFNPVPISPTGSEWDVSDWDEAVWASEGDTQRVLITLNKGGFAGSLWVRGYLGGLSLSWFATQFVMQKTRSLLI